MNQRTKSIRQHARKSRSPGAVLLLVLCAVAILTVLAVEVAHRARLDVQRGQRTARNLALKRAFDSGIAASGGLLLESRKNPAFDYFGDGWSKPLNLELPDGASVHVQIYDESGKLNILKLKGQPNTPDNSDRIISRLFSYMRKNDSERADEWKLAESQVRQRLGIVAASDKVDPKAATQAPVAPLLTLDGLREAGLSKGLIFGASQNSSEKPALALCDLMTTFGDGLINLNTANPGVLATLDASYDDSVVNSISTWRGQRADDGTGDFKAFQMPKDLENVDGIVKKSIGLDPTDPNNNLYTKVQEHLSVHSSCFSAKIDITLGDLRKSGWAFFDVSQPVTGSTNTASIKLITFEEIEQ